MILFAFGVLVGIFICGIVVHRLQKDTSIKPAEIAFDIPYDYFGQGLHSKK